MKHKRFLALILAISMTLGQNIGALATNEVIIKETSGIPEANIESQGRLVLNDEEVTSVSENEPDKKSSIDNVEEVDSTNFVNIDWQAFSGTGEGTVSNPYMITNSNQLDEIRYNLSASYALGNDVDLSSITNWAPIGSEASPFKGNFNGNGHIIYNLSINVRENFDNKEMSTVYYGLFGYINNAAIKNVSIENANYSILYEDYKGNDAFSNVGGIVGGMKSSTISQCYFIGNITNKAGKGIYVRVGTIACIAIDSSSINNCYSNANILAQGYSNNTMISGGAAWLTDSTIDKCYVAGNISGYNTTGYVYSGGINASGGSGKVSNCISMLDKLYSSGVGFYTDNIGNFSTQSGNLIIDSSSPQARNISTYTGCGWDFENIWTLPRTYPTLKVFSTVDNNSITSITQFPGAKDNNYGVNSYKNTSEGHIYNDSVALIKAMDDYLNELKKATEKDIRTINKNTKSPAQLLREADAATNDKIITMDARLPDAALDSVYETLAQYLDMYVETGVRLGKIDMSASTIEISASIVNKIRNNLDSIDFKRKIGQYTVTFKVIKFLGAYSGSVTVQGNGNRYIGVIVSSSKDTAKVMTNYINDMSEWVEDALLKSLKSIFSDLSKITGISDYSKKEINALLKDKVDLLQKNGYGDLLKYWLAMRDGYDICQKIVSAKDADSLIGILDNVDSIYNKIAKLDYSDEAVSNKTVTKAMNKLINAKNNLEQSLYYYIYETDNGNGGQRENWWSKIWGSTKSMSIQCPVDFFVYDTDGNELGRVEDTEATYTSDIYISVDGDAKTVIIPSDIDARIEFIGTDTGDMTYVVEQIVDGEITGRANYYNIPLSDGCAYSQDILGENLTEDNSSSLISDNASYTPTEYISVDNKDANISVKCDVDEGGIAIGSGLYAMGSPVVLTAYPESDSHRFVGWYLGETLVESDSVYRFAAVNDVNIKAVFKTSRETDETFYTVMSEEYEESTNILIYKSFEKLNDIVISMAGLDDIETLKVSLKEYDENYNLVSNSKMNTVYDGMYRFTISDLKLDNISKMEVYNEENQLIGTIKSINSGEETQCVDISDLQTTLSVTEYHYDGSAKYPSVIIKDSEKTLEHETDYAVSYSNNINAGTATITIIGKGNYTGKITKNFIIKAKSISGMTAKLSEISYTYSGSEKKPTISMSGLKSETDYTLSYKNNINVGTATVSIIGKGNYTGTKEVTYAINPQNATSPKASSANYNSIKISWKQSSSATGYEVYRSSKKNGGYNKVSTIQKNSTSSYLDKKLTTGKTYYYKIKAYKTVSGKTYYSSYSSVISAKPSLPQTKLSKVGNVSERKVKLQWKKVTGASGYNIYCSTKKSSGYNLVTTTKKGGTVSYTHKKRIMNKTYYYKIRAYRNVNGKKVYGAYSSAKRVKIKK